MASRVCVSAAVRYGQLATHLWIIIEELNVEFEAGLNPKHLARERRAYRVRRHRDKNNSSCC